MSLPFRSKNSRNSTAKTTTAVASEATKVLILTPSFVLPRLPECSNACSRPDVMVISGKDDSQSRGEEKKSVTRVTERASQNLPTEGAGGE